MITQDSAPGPVPPSRLFGLGEWMLVVGLAGTLAGTTLCLGGFLAETMMIVTPVILGLAVLGGVLWTMGRGPGLPCLNRAALLPVPFLIYALASVLWLAPAKWLAWREWLLWLQMWLVFVLVLHFGRSRRQTGVIVGTCLMLGLAGTGMAAWQRFGDPNWLMLGRVQAEQFFSRSSGMFGIPNSLAALLELMIPGCLTLMFSRAIGVAGKITCGWLAALFLVAMVLTGSRGGWIGLGLALMIWPLLAGRDWRKRLAGTVVILVLVFAGLGALYRFSEAARARIDPFIQGKFEASRPVIWKAGLEIWRDHPWLGSGAASYNVLFDQYRPRGFLNEPNWTHNDYLNTLSDYGLVGFCLWVGAGGALLVLGWKKVVQARRVRVTSGGFFQLAKWRLGLLLGLLAFAFHLGVDFHTKSPALAFAAAMLMALLVRDGCSAQTSRPIHIRSRIVGLIVAVGAFLAIGRLAVPLYRAEAYRYDSRRAIDRDAANGHALLGDILPSAMANFKRAVRTDPQNGQAWADLSYGITQTWHIGATDLVAIGRRAELAADRALAICPVNAEFWVRKGVAADMQSRHMEAEDYFHRALELAPNTPAWWYYLAFHLQSFANRKEAAMQALDVCLTLDPSNSAGVSLHRQLVARP